MRILTSIIIGLCLIGFILSARKKLINWHIANLPLVIAYLSFAIGCVMFLIKDGLSFSWFVIFFVGIPLIMFLVALFLDRKYRVASGKILENESKK